MQKYREGTWFAVTLRDGGYAAGRVSRKSPDSGVLVGYFFGPRLSTPPTVADVVPLTADRAVHICRFGDLHLRDGKWPIVGDSLGWHRDQWPTPRFVRREELPHRAWHVEYDDSDPNRVVSETPIDFDESTFPRDAMSGAGAVEIVLTKLLAAK